MAVDKLVDSTQLNTDLTSIANAIRTKGGTSGQLAFPAGFVSAVQAIPTGTAPSGTKQISITQNGTTTEDVAAYASAEITVNVQGGGGTSANDVLSDMVKKQLTGDIVLDASVTAAPNSYFMSGQRITSFRADGLKSLNGYTFLDCTLLESIQFPALENLYASQCFRNCTSLRLVCFPKLGTGNIPYTYSGTFMGCTSLETADLNILGASNGGLASNDFFGCTNFKTLILRKSDGICPISNINAFQGSPFASGGTGGKLYVPSALISSYQAAPNWSTILGYANNQILPIEGSIYETQYADGTPIN